MKAKARLVACGLVAVLTLGLVPPMAYAVSEEDLSAASAQLESLGAELDELQQSLADKTAEVEMTDYQIGESTAALEQTETQLAEARATLSGRMRSAYKAGKVDIVQVFLDAPSLDDLISRIFLMDKVAANDAQTIADALALQQQVSEQKEGLEAKRAEQEAALTDLRARVDEYGAKMVEAQQYYDDLDVQIQAEIARKQKEEENARIQAALEAAERAREEEERAAREAAAQKEEQSQEESEAATETNEEDAAAQDVEDDAQTADEPASEVDEQPSEEADTSDEADASDETDEEKAPADEPQDKDEAKTTEAEESQPQEEPQDEEEESEPEPEEEEPEEAEEDTQSSSAYAGSGVASAKSCLGLPYCYGATGPDSFDCSGLVCYCYGYDRGRSTYDMIASLKSDGSWKTSMDKLSYGDLVFTSEGHVGIYLGGGQMIHAPHEGTTVSYSSVYSFIGGGTY